MANTIAILLIAAGGIWSAQSAQAETSIALVPKPLRMERRAGQFALNGSTVILLDKDSADAANVGRQLAERIRRATGFDLAVTPCDGKAAIHNAVLLTTKNASAALGPEGYTLDATADGVTIAAGDGPGLFYGTQTLLQLLPPQVFPPAKVEAAVAWVVPAVRIEDRPRFRWRGLMLDVSRHFFNKDEVKNFLDLMAQHKMNTFHWHLTDDPGWRIEIKRYPKLTEVGAWRTAGLLVWNRVCRPTSRTADSTRTTTFGRCFAYAKARYITVVPEIEMPGHSVAALAAYPNLSCAGGAYNPNLGPGTPPGVYCAGNDDTFEFLENVLKEVLDMFPNRLIHIGGDEVAKDNWKKCPKCQARLRHEGLKDEKELQSYFMRRIEKYLTAHGRIPIGWDEILEGGLPPNAVVMSWRGMDGGIAAARLGHDVVMTPHTNCYFNYYQAKNYNQAKASEPRGFSPPWDRLLDAETGLRLRAGACRDSDREGEARSWRGRQPVDRVRSQLRPCAVHGLSTRLRDGRSDLDRPKAEELGGIQEPS